jgi:integrase
MREIKPIDNNGSIQLKFSYAGKRYSFNPIPGADFNKARDLAQANVIATKISNDILAGYFDRTLERYRIAPKASADVKPKIGYLLELWDLWVNSLELSPATKADHYEMVRRMITKAAPKLEATKWLTDATIAPATFNKRLGYLKSCFSWGISQGLLLANPCDRIKSRKTPTSNIKPFNIEEISKIVQGFDRLAPHYSPFVQFLFQSGARISEAIGLRWGNVDLDARLLTISESLSKDRTGNGYARVRKQTKTGSIRQLQMTDSLERLLIGAKTADRMSEDVLVFNTVQGCIIDAGNFRELWQQVLKDVGVSYRRPHIIRHTTLSMAIAQGVPLTGVAYIAGHKNTRMVIQTYGHMIDAPKLPSFNIVGM